MPLNAVPLNMDANKQVKIPVWLRRAIGLTGDTPMKAVWDSREQMIVVIADDLEEEETWKEETPKKIADKYRS